MERMFPDSFDWHTWRNGSLHELDVTYKESEIIKSRAIIKQYAVGYCFGHELICRPKLDCVGVMFLYENVFFWTHLTITEFNTIFHEVLNK